MLLPPALALDLVQACENALLNYSWLARDALDRGQKHWNIVIKFHYFEHLCAQARFLHPRCGWTYTDEDFMMRMSLIAKASTGGTAAHKLPNTIATRYLRALYLRWSSRLPLGGAHWNTA